MAAAMREGGDLDAAESLTREVLSLYEGKPPKPALWMVLDSLAQTLYDQGRLGEAEQSAEKAVAMARRFLGEEHVALARCEILLARIRLTREGPDAASPLLRQAAMIYRRSQSSDHWRGAEAESLLGECLLAPRPGLPSRSAARPEPPDDQSPGWRPSARRA